MKKIVAALLTTILTLAPLAPLVATADTPPATFTIKGLQYFMNGIGAEFIYNGHITPGKCMQSGNDGLETTVDFACAHVEYGSQTILGVAGSCIPGALVVFDHPYNTPPDISFGTEPIVGDTGAYSLKTTTGFVPNLCGTAGVPDTINWVVTGT